MTLLMPYDSLGSAKFCTELRNSCTALKASQAYSLRCEKEPEAPTAGTDTGQSPGVRQCGSAVQQPQHDRGGVQRLGQRTASLCGRPGASGPPCWRSANSPCRLTACIWSPSGCPSVWENAQLAPQGIGNISITGIDAQASWESNICLA